jgi:Domain of unknown function (DUF1905)
VAAKEATWSLRGRPLREAEPVRGGGAFVLLPEEVLAALGGASRTRVTGTLAGVAIASSTMGMGEGRVALGVHKATREAAGVDFGDLVDVEVERDDRARVVAVPETWPPPSPGMTPPRRASSGSPRPVAANAWSGSPAPSARRPGLGASPRPWIGCAYLGPQLAIDEVGAAFAAAALFVGVFPR